MALKKINSRITEKDKEWIKTSGLTVRQLIEKGIHATKLEFRGLDFDWRKEDIEKRLWVLEKDNDMHLLKISNLEIDIKNIKNKINNNKVEISSLKEDLADLNQREELFTLEIMKNLNELEKSIESK